MIETTLDFIRHGEPDGGRRYRGHGVDDPLSEKGWQQMWGSISEPISWSQIISSPMQRCHAFADALNQKYDIPVEIDPRLKEVGFGSWESKTPDEIKQTNPQEYKDFYADPVTNRPLGAEPLDDFGQRVSQAMEDAVLNHPGKHVLVIAHAGVIRAALGHVMESPAQSWYRVKVNNAAITRFQHNELGFQLIFHNLHPTVC